MAALIRSNSNQNTMHWYTFGEKFRNCIIICNSSTNNNSNITIDGIRNLQKKSKKVRYEREKAFMDTLGAQLVNMLAMEGERLILWHLRQ